MARSNKNNRAVTRYTTRDIEPRRGRSRGRVEETEGQARGQQTRRRATARGQSTPPSPTGADRPPRSPSIPPMPDSEAWTAMEILCTKNNKTPEHVTKSLSQLYHTLLRAPPLSENDYVNRGRPSLSPQLVDLIWSTLMQLSAENGGSSVSFTALLSHAALASSKSYLLHFFLSLGWYKTATTSAKSRVLLTPVFGAAPAAAGTDGSHLSDDGGAGRNLFGESPGARTLVDPGTDPLSGNATQAPSADEDDSKPAATVRGATTVTDTETEEPADSAEPPAATVRGGEPEATVPDTETEEPTYSDEPELEQNESENRSDAVAVTEPTDSDEPKPEQNKSENRSDAVADTEPTDSDEPKPEQNKSENLSDAVADTEPTDSDEPKTEQNEPENPDAEPTDSDEPEPEQEIQTKLQAFDAKLSQLRFESEAFTGEPPFAMTEEHNIIIDATDLIAETVELRKSIPEMFFGELAIMDVSRIEQLRTSRGIVLGVEAEARSIRALALLQSGEFQVAHKQCAISLEAIQKAGPHVAGKDSLIGKLLVCLCFASLALGDLEGYLRWERAANTGENGGLLLLTVGPAKLLQKMQIAFLGGSLDVTLTKTKLRDLVAVADEFLVLMPDSAWMQVCKTRILFKLRFWPKSRAYLEEVAVAVYKNPYKLLIYKGDLESDNPYSCLVQDLGPDKILHCFLDPILAKAYIRNLIVSNRSGTAMPLLKESGGTIAAQEIASTMRLDEYLPILRMGAGKIRFEMFEFYMQQCKSLKWEKNFAEDVHFPSEAGMLSLYLRACKAIRILNDRNNGMLHARTQAEQNCMVAEAMQLAESCLHAYGYYPGGPTNFEKPFPVAKVTDIIVELICARAKELHRCERYFDEWKDRGLILQLAANSKFGFSKEEVPTLEKDLVECLEKCTDSEMLGKSIQGKTDSQIKKLVWERKRIWHSDKNGTAKWCSCILHRLDKI